MSELEWRDPLFLLAGLLSPLVYLLAARTSASLTYSNLALLDGAPRSLRSRLARLPAVLLAVAALILAVALAGPRTGNVETKIKRKGIAIALVVDRSGSMHARDLVPLDIEVDRLQVVKRVISEFVEGGESGQGRPDDVIGLVSFARYADGLCPLTMDHGNLLGIIDDLEIVAERAEDGTAIGEGLALAVERLRKSKARSKVAILLTDGDNNAGDIEPVQAAELASQHDIRVYTVGAGSKGMAPVPVDKDRDGNWVLRNRPVTIDEKTLRDIARRTGGRYYRATDADGLAAAYREIDSLERTEIQELRYFEYQEHYEPCVLVALACLALSGIIGGTLLRRLP